MVIVFVCFVCMSLKCVMRYAIYSIQQFSFDMLPLLFIRIWPTKAYHIAKWKVRKIKTDRKRKEHNSRNEWNKIVLFLLMLFILTRLFTMFANAFLLKAILALDGFCTTRLSKCNDFIAKNWYNVYVHIAKKRRRWWLHSSTI